MVQLVEPEVHLIAETGVVREGLQRLLQSVGAPDWETDAQSEAEELMEVAGRLCYRSFAPGLNPNVTRVREGNNTYLGNILNQKHGSVLEHGSVTFAFLGVSRVFTHELVRHRVGTAYSQESLRFVRLDALVAYYPEVGFGEANMRALWDALPEPKPHSARERWAMERAALLRCIFKKQFEIAEGTQQAISDILMLDRVDGSFSVKKKITSAMRRLAPDGLGTAIITTANHRTLRDVIEKRTSRHAEEEIRKVYAEVFGQLHERFPAVYSDVAAITEVDGINEIVFKNQRV